MNQALQDIKSSREYSFQLIKGHESSGEPYYAFMLMNKLYAQKIIERKHIDLANDGLLILKGTGHDVHAETRAEAMRRFQKLVVHETPQ